jgi:chemotaxis protein methyltransferase WspC
MKTIAAFLRERIGLHCEAAGLATIERLVRWRMRALGFARIEDYYHHLMGSGLECSELFEGAVVKETWFFRDPEAFAGLTRTAVEQWLPQNPRGTMRVLSLPCSTGEEPFSVAMALLDAGVSPDRFQIDAMDISRRALAAAQKSVYGRNAFRGKDLSFREHHFRQAGTDFVLNHGIRRQVRFGEGNLLSPGFAALHPQYDIIFFRNLLIYLDQEAQNQAMQKIEKVLGSGGILFVGSAELPIVLDWGLVSAELPLAFACRKRVTRQPRPSCSQPTSCPSNGAPVRPVLAQSLLLPSNGDLGQARRLADRGRLNEAAAICEAHLRKSRFSAQAYYLLGLVREARGDPRAVDCYRKALYLEPNHYETLLQLAVLSEQQGDAQSARNFQRRAQRLERHNPRES